MSEQADYDVTGVIDKLGGDREFIAECVDLFEAELPLLMTSLRDGVSADSPERVQAAAHALKGMTSNFCEDGPAKTAGRIDHLAREGHLQDAPELVAQLEGELARLLAALHALKTSNPGTSV
jgi:HPt (histidine-containing phosphotransfer) domain-containing protein